MSAIKTTGPVRQHYKLATTGKPVQVPSGSKSKLKGGPPKK